VDEDAGRVDHAPQGGPPERRVAFSEKTSEGAQIPGEGVRIGLAREDAAPGRVQSLTDPGNEKARGHLGGESHHLGPPQDLVHSGYPAEQGGVGRHASIRLETCRSRPEPGALPSRGPSAARIQDWESRSGRSIRSVTFVSYTPALEHTGRGRSKSGSGQSSHEASVAQGVLCPSKSTPARAETSPSLGAREPESAAGGVLRSAARGPFLGANSVHRAARRSLRTPRRSLGFSHSPPELDPYPKSMPFLPFEMVA